MNSYPPASRLHRMGVNLTKLGLRFNIQRTIFVIPFAESPWENPSSDGYPESILSKFSFAAWIPYKSDVLCRHGV
jgi:hypothetical protein